MADPQGPPTYEMERAIAALAVELPGPVWEDVRDRWHAARDALVASYDAKVEDFRRETLRTSAALAACAQRGIKAPMRILGEAGFGWDDACETIEKAIREAVPDGE